MIPYNPLVFAVCHIQPSSESKENKGDDVVISSVDKGHMDWRHVHLISWLTGKGSRVSNFRLLGTQVNQQFNWKEEINSKISSCYATLAVIRTLKHLTLFHIQKQLEECLILSKIVCNNIVSHPIPEYLLKRLQRVQLATVGFVLWRYAHMPGLIKLGWMPIKERGDIESIT